MGELSPEQWAQAEGLFARALELPAHARSAFLEQECADEDVRQEVASLLAHDSGGRLGGAEAAIAAAAAEMAQEVNPDEQMVGARMGPYRLLAISGYGGMGAVYRASRDDGEFRQQVAIKLVRAAAESPGAQQKFRQERQILARLAHPNIARLLDGGSTPEGVPYLVMEFIEGESITQWCDAHALSTEERLRIFLPVCDGVEAAHREHVIHRDLKPANILVTRDGVPKLLDFGIAKMLDPDTPHTSATATRFQAMTPEYAAPEQIRGAAVSPATDVYSLGLVLYEVLTGEKAQRASGQSPAEIEKTICRAEPKAPMLIKPQLAGDVDKIIRMAIRKEPERRYQTAADLAEDIRQYLSGKPVVARPDTFTYRVSRFLHRNRVSFRAGVISAVCVIGGLLLTYSLTRPASPPRLLQVLQLTQSAHIEIHGRIVTDGSKLYFTQKTEGRESLATIPVNGGTASPLHLPASLADAWILDISPDGSELLIATGRETQYGDSIWAVRTTGGSARRVGISSASYAVWSRDGRQIFFISGSALFAVNVDGTGRRKLRDIPEGSYDLRVAPGRGRNVLRLSVFNGDMMSSGIWEVTVDGTGFHPVLPNQHAGSDGPNALYSGDWIPSGRYYFLRSRHAGISSFWAMREKRGELSLRDARQVKIYATPLETRSFTADRDAKRIFFAAAQSSADLTRYDANRRQFLPFLRGIAARSLCLSKNGKEVAYISYPQENLWKSLLDGSKRVQLTFSDLRVFRPRWSPDGKTISFTGIQAGQPGRAYTIPLAGGTPELIDADVSEIGPSWSPREASLLVTRVDKKEPASLPGIYKVDWKTRKSEFLRGSDGLGHGEWSPDGRFIVARSRNDEVRLLDVRTGRWSALAHGSGISELFWSRDSQYVFFQNQTGVKGQPVLRVRISDRKEEQLMNSSQIPQSDFTSYSLVGLAPDDAPIASVVRSNSEIYALDVDLP